MHPSALPLENIGNMSDEEYTEYSLGRIRQLVHKCQMHKHSPTCRKKGTHCRFLFPRPLIEQTIVELDPLRILNRRSNSMVNNYNDYILLALKANHDIQPLFCSLFESMSALFI